MLHIHWPRFSQVKHPSLGLADTENTTRFKPKLWLCCRVVCRNTLLQSPARFEFGESLAPLPQQRTLSCRHAHVWLDIATQIPSPRHLCLALPLSPLCMRTAVDVSYTKCVLSAYFHRLDPSYNKLHSPVAALLYRYCRIKPLFLIQVVPKRHDVDSMSSHIRLGLANSICRLLRNCSLACANSANLGTFQEPISSNKKDLLWGHSWRRRVQGRKVCLQSSSGHKECPVFSEEKKAEIEYLSWLWCSVGQGCSVPFLWGTNFSDSKIHQVVWECNCSSRREIFYVHFFISAVCNDPPASGEVYIMCYTIIPKLRSRSPFLRAAINADN